MIIQQGDVFLCDGPDGGELNFVDGVIEMRGSLYTSAYLSLFGGNDEDLGEDNATLQWWGNIDDVQPARRYRSRFQQILKGTPASSANILALTKGAEDALAWMITEGAASDINVEITIPGYNKVQVDIAINAIGNPEAFTFFANWKRDIEASETP